MKVRRTLAGAGIAALTVLSLAGPAAAQPAPKPTFDKLVGIVKIDPKDPGVATLHAIYRCSVADPVADPPHLWVSAKQNDAGTQDPALEQEGSGFGGTATRWEDSHRNVPNCDGRIHVGRFTVDQVEDKSGYGTLTDGKAWVQFCLFDDTTPKGDGVTDFGQPVSDMQWVNVH
jgi:hypothetical protein